MIAWLHGNYKWILWISVLFFSASYAIEIFHGGHAWKTGDWLINYSGGFVRRGLVGSAFVYLFNSEVYLLWALYFFKVAIYGLLFYCVISIYDSKDRSPYFVLLMLSPAYLLFPFYDMVGAFRKEILVFVIFALYCLFYVRRGVSGAVLMFLLMVFVLIGANHESAAFTSPFFMYMTYLSFRNGQLSRKEFILGVLGFALASLLLLLISNQYRGDDALVHSICQKLLETGMDPQICSGSIDWLADTPGEARLKVLNNINGFPYLTLLGFGLAMMPAFFLGFWGKDNFYLFLISLIAFLPLFMFALDWGRWIYMYTFFISTIALSVGNECRLNPSPVIGFLGIIYLAVWSLPHCCAGSINYGLVGILIDYPQKIIHHLSMLL